MGLATLLMGGSVGAAYAQAMQPYQEYDKRLRTAEQVGALKSDLFGDAINMFDQSVAFEQTDIDIPGTNTLPVKLTRKLVIRPTPLAGIAPHIYGGVGDWNIDVPYISGVFDSAYGWNVTVGMRKPRCTDIFYPYTLPPHRIEDIWSGYSVNLPGQGARSLIALPPAQFKPDNRQASVWTTSALDSITCTPMVAGYEGEGFVLQTTDGITYTFNIGTTRYAGNMGQDVKNGGARPRVEVFLLASRIEDRFGNSVAIAYNSNGHPTSITASDGRAITLQYANNRLASASAHGRSWIYAYNGELLQRIVQPDQAAWEINHLSDMRVSYMTWTEDPGPGCGNVAPLSPKSYSVQMKHPSGAVGTFRFDHQRHYRDGVPSVLCQGEAVSGSAENNSAMVHHLAVPIHFDVLGLTRKTIEGPGLPAPLVWSYEGANGETALWSGVVPPCTACTGGKSVAVVQPDGSVLLEHYGTVYSRDEGKLLGRSTVAANGTKLEQEDLTYVTSAQANSMPFPDRYGSRWGGNDESSVLVRPLAKKVITRDGVTMSWNVSSFDAKARPLQVVRSSSLGDSRTDVTAYYDDTARWLLGQTAKTTNVNTGLVESQTSFNVLGMPQQKHQFGKLVQSLTYHPDGSVASFVDGRGNSTALNNWKRGTPQSIGFADGTSLSASVDDNGWIRAVTNEQGYQTSYDYDAMGRITAKTHGAGDSVAWNPTTQVFERVHAVEHGIASGHWRLTSSTGNHRRFTWFDALWRPVLTRELDATLAETERYQRFTYDHAGRATFQSYPSSSASPTAGEWSEFDALGRPTSISADSELGLLTTVTEYLSGLRVRTTNPRGQKSVTSHQVFDNPNYDAPTRIEHPAGAFTEIARDRFGKVLSIKRRNADSSTSLTRSYVYDSFQQLCKSVEPESGATVMTYDPAGNLFWSAAGLTLTSLSDCETSVAQSSGRRVDRSYDSRNRLSRLSFPDGNGSQDWSYTADGKPSQVVTANSGGRQVINTYAYNKRGLIVGETMQQQGVGIWTMGYGYNGNAALASLQYPSGQVIALAPNALGQATQAGPYASGARYYPNGGLRSFTYGNGIVRNMVQNARGMPARAIDTTVLDTTFSYDSNGNVTATVDAVEPAKSRQMQYDALDRLTYAKSSSFGGDGTYRYTYDVLDNIRSAKLGGVKQHNYWYDARNRMTTVNLDDGSAVIGIAYDAQGNLAKKNGDVFSFDYGNRLRDGAGRESYAYDAQGRRVGSYSAALGDILSFYGNDGVLRRQHNKRTGKELEYISLGGSLVAELESLVVLGTPSLSGPATVATGTYTAAWTSVGNASRYELHGSINGGASWTAVYSGPAASYTVTGASTGARSYRVRACQGSTCGGWSIALVVQVLPIPSSAPALVVPAAGLNGSYTVSWAAVAGATRYDIEERAGSAAWRSVHGASSTSVSLTGRAAGAYAYRGRACNASGCSGWSVEHAMTVIYPSASAPAITAPTNSGTGAYTVSWSTVAGSTRYEPQERLGDGAWTNISATTVESLAVSGKQTGSHGYQVRACNAAGCSPWSNTVTTIVLLPPAAAPAISLPTNNGSGEYQVTWNAVPGSVEYVLEERINGESWIQLQSEAATLYAATGRGNGAYGYRVRACNSSGCSGWSAEKTTTVLRAPVGPILTTPATNNTGAWMVTWPVVSTATSYQLEESVNGAAWKSAQTSAGLSWATTGRGSATYGYRAKACNTSGCSSYSASVSTVVTLPPSSAPSLTLPGSSTNGAYTLSWASVGTATSYLIEQQSNGGAWSSVKSTNERSIAFSGKGNGTYGYRVKACNDGGCGTWSPTAATTVLLKPSGTPTLTAPTGTSAAYTVSWTTVATAGTYVLEQNIDGGAWSAQQDTAATSIARDPATSGKYGYRVKACNGSGCGNYSATKVVTVLKPPRGTNVGYAHQRNYYAGPHNSEYSLCTVSWSSSPYADRYELSAPGGLRLLYSGSATSVTSPMYSASYCAPSYIVRACNAAGCSGWSQPYTGTFEQEPHPGDGDPGQPPRKPGEVIP
ncbi:RHS repeat protein [Stenotrophomonas sp. TWI273]|uniref:RHS repeat protein n=1 Tax=Stenotrophomonas sp. TWI273 TaxID=3136774 RepID=UPI003207D114